MVRIISCLFLMSCRSVVFLLLHLLINLIFYPYKLYMRFLFVYWQVRFSFTLSVFGRHLFSLSILPKTKIDDQNMKFVKGYCIYLFLLFEKHQNHMHLLPWLNINAVFVIKKLDDVIQGRISTFRKLHILNQNWSKIQCDILNIVD